MTQKKARGFSYVRLTDVPDYISWTLSPEPARIPTIRTARPCTSGAVSWSRAGTRRCGGLSMRPEVPATYGFVIKAARPVTPWPAGKVTLLGDAIHTMTPGRGEGANTALRDAALLRDALADVAANRVSLNEAVARYQRDAALQLRSRSKLSKGFRNN
jgi:2-polyprenyl-6-methoxyphenol hydroxylase-like FAD-dependent oxidoreductase